MKFLRRSDTTATQSNFTILDAPTFDKWGAFKFLGGDDFPEKLS